MGAFEFDLSARNCNSCNDCNNGCNNGCNNNCNNGCNNNCGCDCGCVGGEDATKRSEEHTSELQSHAY